MEKTVFMSVNILYGWNWAESTVYVSLELHDVQFYSTLIWGGMLKCGELDERMSVSGTVKKETEFSISL
jgi:hypothetical protein